VTSQKKEKNSGVQDSQAVAGATAKTTYLLKLLPFALLLAAFVLLGYFKNIPIWIGLVLFGTGLILVWLAQKMRDIRVEFLLVTSILAIVLISILLPVEGEKEKTSPISEDHFTLELIAEDVSSGLGDLIKGQFVTIYMTNDPDPAIDGNALISPFLNLQIVEILDENKLNATLTGAQPKSILISGTEDKIETIITKLSDGYKARLIMEGATTRITPDPVEDDCEIESEEGTIPPKYSLDNCADSDCPVRTFLPDAELKVKDSVMVILVYEVCTENCLSNDLIPTRESQSVKAAIKEITDKKIYIAVDGATDSPENLNFAKWFTRAVEIHIHKLPDS
jgi:hypothetical protein